MSINIDKDKQIEELKQKINTASANLINANADLLKQLNPELSEKEALEGGAILMDKMLETNKTMTTLVKSLDDCKTTEEITMWRLNNHI
jgi:uracil phosphoribosyltransferase